MLERGIFAGSGGQGVLTIGKTVAEVGLDSVSHVTYFPSYGTEVRGGTANCQVILSDEEIASPIADVVDSIFIMNQPSLERFIPRLSKRGTAFVNSSMAAPDLGDPRIIALPVTDIANDLGDVRAANVVLLGAYIADKSWAPIEKFENLLRKRLGSKGTELVSLNLKALERGFESVARR